MDEAKIHEIVIIKRVRAEEDDTHHGGVWKIAFADFMTALMAFFLVMWLISANDKTKATIARYFNPVLLVDATPQRPGLSDPNPTIPSVVSKEKPSANHQGKTDKSASGGNPVATTGKNEADADKAGTRDEAQLFRDPYAVLAELAAKNSIEVRPEHPKGPSEGVEGGSGAVGASRGEAFRDPFEPVPIAPATADLAPAVPSPKESASKLDASVRATAADVGEDRQTAELRAKLIALAAQTQTSGSSKEPRVEVKRTPEGVLVDITDGANFSMFASASADPAPKMVALMEKVGRLLATSKGKIAVRGFTDSHPFRSDTYDNWRLSSARAHMAHYMLVRGGLDENRIDSVEGYADRRPKNPKEPESPENRRIEILLRDPVT